MLQLAEMYIGVRNNKIFREEISFSGLLEFRFRMFIIAQCPASVQMSEY